MRDDADGAPAQQRGEPGRVAGPTISIERTQPCQECGAPLAADQRYCLACGERRGKARFPAVAATAPAAGEVVKTTTRRERPRLTSGGALIAGVGTLLLAIGVGVLIGRTNNTPVAGHSPVQVITVAGSGGGGSGSSGSSSSGSSSGGKSSGKNSASKPTKVVITKKVAAKASAAASKVLGGTVDTPPTVTVGQSGHGAGFTGGHFTGTFFH